MLRTFGGIAVLLLVAATVEAATTEAATAFGAAVAAGTATAATAENAAQAPSADSAPRSAVFLHPDGMGANTWGAVRLREVGPDGRLNWDRLPALAVYVGPMLDGVTASSNGGATTH